MYFFLCRWKPDISSSTLEAKLYEHPDNDSIGLTDLPGLGTEKYPDAKAYYEELNLKTKYQVFLLFTKSNYSRHTYRLVKLLQKAKQKFLLVITFMDEDEKKEKMDLGEKKFDKSKMKDDICEYIHESLEIKNKADIFLISNVCTVDENGWDFTKLKNEISKMKPVPCNPLQLQKIFRKVNRLTDDKGKSNLYFLSAERLFFASL